MADRKTFSRYNMRCGLVLKAEKAGVRLTGFTIPNHDQKFLVLTGKDIHGNNSISMLDGEMPILATDNIEYVGQPLLAVFGPDYEAVELFMAQIEVQTAPYDTPIAPSENNETSDDTNNNTNEEQEENKEKNDTPIVEEIKSIPNLSFSWGLEDYPDEDGLKQLKSVSSSFSLEHMDFISPMRYTIKCWQEGNSIHIQAPMQWPELVHRAISSATDRESKTIILHPVRLENTHDEYLLYPALYSTLAVVATLLTGLPVEMRIVGHSARAEISIKRTTYLNEENHPVAEDVKMSIDQGAYSFAGEEYQRQAMAGLLPTYSVKSFKAEIEVIKSNNPPASFCGSLGYSEALAGTEYHTSMLANKSGLTPIQIRNELKRDKTKFTDYAPSYQLDDKFEKLLEISKLSFFDRKWVSNSFFSGDFGLLGKLRGIGVGTGVGISGISTSMAKKEQFTTLMCYTTKKNLTINISSNLSEDETKYYKDIIRSHFKGDISADNIVFLDKVEDTLDNGPDVLSRFQSTFPTQLGIATKQLSTLIKKTKPPVPLKFNAENMGSPCEFEYSGYGALILEIEISKNDFIPIVISVWGSFLVDKSIPNGSAKAIAKKTILKTIRECGGRISPNLKFYIDICQTEEESEALSPVDSIARGIATSAFASALAEAMGIENITLPIGAEKLERLLRERE